ncbi:MAG TPA: hypothetical protein VM182_07835 [Terriglobia bacterium]|nr:hypothetical protein [Terriglobia bacterium]
MRVSRIVVFVFLFCFLSSLLYAADVTGKWTGGSDGGPRWVFNFKSEGSKITGTMAGSDGKERPIKEGKLEGDAISFSVDSEWQGEAIKLVVKGKVAGDEMELRIDRDDGAWGTDAVVKRSSE